MFKEKRSIFASVFGDCISWWVGSITLFVETAQSGRSIMPRLYPESGSRERKKLLQVYFLVTWDTTGPCFLKFQYLLYGAILRSKALAHSPTGNFQVLNFHAISRLFCYSKTIVTLYDFKGFVLFWF